MSKRYTQVTIRGCVRTLPHWDYRELRKMVWNNLTMTVDPFNSNTPLDAAIDAAMHRCFFDKYEHA